MFSVNNKQENGFDIVILHDQSSGSSVEIIPGCGAILHAFNIDHEEASLNIIEQYKSKKDFDDRVEEGGFKSCKLSPFVCRLKNGQYKFGETDYTINKFYLGKHALHGLLYDAPFNIVKLDADTQSAIAELLFYYKGTDKGYPFKYDCRIIYELAENATLHITTIIKNNENTAIPIADGWHPYFSFGGSVNDLYLHIQSDELLEFDDELIPTKNIVPNKDFVVMQQVGAKQMDSCFLVKPSPDKPAAILKDDTKKIQLEIYPDKSYPFLQVYIPGHRRSIAIENLSAAPDAFNNQLNVCIVPAGKEAIFKTCYKINNTKQYE